jgi:hypothetical protein
MRQADSLRAVLDSVFAAPAYRWEEHPNPLAFVGRWLTAAREWLEALRIAHPLMFRAVVAGLLVLALATLLHAAWVFAATLRASRQAMAAPPPSGEHRNRAWHQREAERLAGMGRYPEAVQQEFLALVLALDARALLRFHPSKTPAEYGREARLPPETRGEFLELVRGVYGFAFARLPCGPAEWDQWRARAAPERYAPAS